MALDAWMWALRDETELAQQVEQPILFINMEAFQTAENLASMKLFLTDHIERRVVTIKYFYFHTFICIGLLKNS